MDASTETKSRKKSSDRKLEILRTLVRMMTESENKHITTKSLAAAIGVSEAALYRHFPSKTKMYEELGGFVAIGSIFPSSWDWHDFWLKTAFLSIILAVMNLLPIPGLDGGHALFTLWEIITRRKPSEKFLEVAQYVGLMIILALLVYANGNDIYRFFIK